MKKIFMLKRTLKRIHYISTSSIFLFFSRTRCPTEIVLSRSNTYSCWSLSDDRRLFAALKNRVDFKNNVICYLSGLVNTLCKLWVLTFLLIFAGFAWNNLFFWFLEDFLYGLWSLGFRKLERSLGLNSTTLLSYY